MQATDYQSRLGGVPRAGTHLRGDIGPGEFQVCPRVASKERAVSRQLRNTKPELAGVSLTCSLAWQSLPAERGNDSYALYRGAEDPAQIVI